MTLLFARPDGGVVKLTENALRTIARYRQTAARMPEAGGVLIGRLIVESNDIVIDRATEPSSEDERGRFFFRRGRRASQRKVSRAWRESNGALRYLGEWHTHPEVIPNRSSTDYQDQVRTLRDVSCEHDCLFFVIAGTTGTAIWEGSRTTRRIVPLHPVV